MRVEVKIPDPGDIEEVEVAEVFVGQGDVVQAGDALVEVETDKANMELEAPVAGTVAEILVAEGDIINPNRVLVVLEAEG